ncbi:ligand-gated channel [Azorhizobium oxalatiphilum]|uniref:Ligand-gated channel n=1 Tax=Azorhizobium oxalatiphilum TaxID=980631 RepID=A0A917C833_9HYPH|nr:TonB-dependent receptor [Azorhizobium oxalatiphilum]GGF75137.1 ligand-gated channel [Azorhizobium oxalatiphilum]
MADAGAGRGINRGVHGRFLAALMLGSALSIGLVPGVLPAHDATAQAARTHAFNIPSQPLNTALRQLAEQSGVQIAYQTSIASGTTAPAVSGTMSAEAALGRLLAGTSLRYSFSGTNTVTILGPRAAADPNFSSDGSLLLSEVTVSGETATGPVDGYRATMSATGTGTGTPLRDIPYSVQVVPRDLITDRQTTSLTEALQNVPGVQMDSTAANRGDTYIIRGFQAPAYAIDGIMMGASADRPETFLDLANVERVEVLKGPASALYGQAQPGGVINIVTRQPTNVFEADASAQVGSFGFWRGQSSVSGPLTADGTLTGRVTGAAQTEQGFRGSERIATQRQFGGTALRWQPNDSTRFTFGLDYTSGEQPYDRGLVVSPGINKVMLPRDRYLHERWSQVHAEKLRLALGFEHELNDWLKVKANLRYDDGLSRDTGIDLQGLQADGRTMRRRWNDRTEDTRGIDARLEAEAKFNTGSIGHTVLAGFQQTSSEINFINSRGNIASIDIYFPVYGAPMTPLTAAANYIAKINTSSVYVQDQINLTEQWKLLGGLRYDQTTQTTQQFIGSATPDIDEAALTKRFGIVYQPTEALSLYASYAESFTPQSGLTRDNQGLDPEEGEQYEAGVKYDVIPNQLTATLAVFQITKQNVATTDPTDSDYSVLTGEQRVRGVELDLSGEITPGWRMMASAAYLDAKITQDEDYAVGNRLTGVPEWSGAFWTTYEFRDGPLNKLKVGGGVTLVGVRQGDLDNSFSVGGFYTLDLMASYKLTDNLELSVIGKNITDQNYILAPVTRNENYPGAPMSVLAQIKTTF